MAEHENTRSADCTSRERAIPFDCASRPEPEAVLVGSSRLRRILGEFVPDRSDDGPHSRRALQPSRPFHVEYECKQSGGGRRGAARLARHRLPRRRPPHPGRDRRYLRRRGTHYVLTEYLRRHWAIENEVHYVRDVASGEDACRAVTGNLPRALATLRNPALSALRQTG